jgi:aryl-alcohol dehydrogenase-like predicted oxidoreductase
MEISPIGLGCWQFSGGQGVVGKYWRPLSQDDVNQIVRVSISGGINWLDTAEAYGWGESERAVARALEENHIEPGGALIATKWFPFLRFAGSIGKTIVSRQDALSPFPIDLYQIHFPASISSLDKQIDQMLRLAEGGHIRAVGISNFSAKQMRRAHARLQDAGMVLASNQVRYSMLDRRIEHNGVLQTAQELGITIIAYSPLSQGILTGKFHGDSEARARLSGPRKMMKQFKPAGLEKTQPLIDGLKEVASRHDASAAQVSLAWTIRRFGSTVVAIPGASSVSQAESNAAAMRVELSEEEIAKLDELSHSVV